MDTIETRIQQYISDELYDDGDNQAILLMISNCPLYRSKFSQSGFKMAILDCQSVISAKGVSPLYRMSGTMPETRILVLLILY